MGIYCFSIISFQIKTNVVLVLIGLIVARVRSGSYTSFSPWVACIALFRDATMFRETVEYLWYFNMF